MINEVFLITSNSDYFGRSLTVNTPISFVRHIQHFIKLALIMVLLFTSSCEKLHPNFTENLWKNKTDFDFVKNILISESGDDVIIIGEKYHYIFKDKSKTISKIFKERDDLDPRLLNSPEFRIKKGNSVIANFTVVVESSKLKKYEELLSGLGFKEKYDELKEGSKSNQARKIIGLEKEVSIGGKIYRPDNKTDYTKIPSALKRDIEIHLTYEHGFLKKLYSVPLTPVTVTADVLFPFFIIGMVGVVFVSVPIYLAGCFFIKYRFSHDLCKISSGKEENNHKQ